MIGNEIKSTLANDNIIDTREIQDLAIRENLMYIETATKTGVNVNESITQLTRSIIERRTQ